MLKINPGLSIDDNELSYEFIRSSGPGGQNVNKVATCVQLRFDVANSPSLNPATKIRLTKLAGSRLTQAGVLVIEAKRYRSQEQNRFDAEQRLISLINQALARPKKRFATHPGPAAIARRVETKKRRGSLKRIRQSLPDQNE
jgi:ribosome-associated protein